MTRPSRILQSYNRTFLRNHPNILRVVQPILSKTLRPPHREEGEEAEAEEEEGLL